MKILRYIIIGSGRSGTTAVHLLLKGHPQVSALNDEIKPLFFEKGLETFTFGAHTKNEKDREWIQLFDAIAGINKTPKTSAFGLKIAVWDSMITHKVVESIQNNFPEIKIIITRRNDIVAQYASGIRAKKTGNWHSWKKSKYSNKKKVITLNKLKYENYLVENLKIAEHLNKLKLTHSTLEFSFEKDLCNNIYPKLFKHIEVQNLTPTWFKSKKVSSNASDYVLNYSKMKKLTEGYSHVNNGSTSLFYYRKINQYVAKAKSIYELLIQKD